MYSKIVEYMLQIIEINHGATIECKWKLLKKSFSHAQTIVFWPSRHLWNTLRNIVQRKNGLIKNAMKLDALWSLKARKLENKKAWKCLFVYYSMKL